RNLGVFEEVLDRTLQALGDDLERPGRRQRPSQLDLVEEGTAEVFAGHSGQAQAKLPPGSPNAGSQGSRGRVRAALSRSSRPRVKHGLQSSSRRLSSGSPPFGSQRVGPDRVGTGEDCGRQGQQGPPIQPTAHGDSPPGPASSTGLLPPDSAASPDSSLGSLEPEQGHGP